MITKHVIKKRVSKRKVTHPWLCDLNEAKRQQQVNGWNPEVDIKF